MVAALNGWTPPLKAVYLVTSLRGPTQAVLDDLGASQRTDFPSLINALDARFGTALQTEFHRAQLRRRIRRNGESLQELAQAIRRLVSRAYPDSPLSVRETLGRDFFIDAIGDVETRWRVNQSRPAKLKDALNAAQELEAFQMADPKPNARRLEARETPDAATSESLIAEIRSLREAISQMQMNGGASSKQGGQEKRPRVCWQCGLLPPGMPYLF